MTILNMVGGGASGPKVPLDAISVFTVVGGDEEATITWTDPSDLTVNGVTVTTWSSTKLVRKVGSAPTNSNDGTLVVTETVRDTYSVSGYNDTGLTNGTTYYYAAFAVGNNGLETISSSTPSVTPEGRWQPGANTIAYYPLRSDANDASTNHNDLTVEGTVTYTQVGGATINTGHFTGGANYLYTNNATGIPQGVSPSTWSIRVYVTQAQTSGHDGTLFAFGKNGTSNALRTMFYEGGSTNTGISQRGAASSRYTLSLNTWYNLVCTYDGSDFRLYVNGNTTPAVTWNKSINTDGNNIWIMGQTRENNYGVVGNAGDAIIEDKARTAQEIQDYFNQTKSLYGIS